jgi:hypothetical protein
VMHPHFAVDPRAVKRFFREARPSQHRHRLRLRPRPRRPPVHGDGTARRLDPR